MHCYTKPINHASTCSNTDYNAGMDEGIMLHWRPCKRPTGGNREFLSGWKTAVAGPNLNNKGNYHKKVFGELACGVFHKRMINHIVNEKAEQSSPGWYVSLTVRADTQQPKRLFSDSLMGTLNADSCSLEVDAH